MENESRVDTQKCNGESREVGRDYETSDEVVGQVLGNRVASFDSYQMVYPQESRWVLDLRVVADDADTLRAITGDYRILTKAYAKHGAGGKHLRLLGWSWPYRSE